MNSNSLVSVHDFLPTKSSMEVPFGSNLGEHITSFDVSGGHRFKYFTNAISLPSISSSSHKFEVRGENTVEKKYTNAGAQTEVYVHVPEHEEKEEFRKALQEKEIMRMIQIERKKREQERKEQEAGLPPMTDEVGVKAYRAYLEENEKKDFSLREKELDDAAERKLLQIEEHIMKKYADHHYVDEVKHQEEVAISYHDKEIPAKRKQGRKNNGTSGRMVGITNTVDKISRKRSGMQTNPRRRLELAQCLDLVESFMS